MRDIKTGDNYGNITINDTTNHYKPLAHCSNEELISERVHRQKLLKDEQNRKLDIFKTALAISGVCAIVVAVWYFLAGESNIAMFIIGLVGAFPTIGAIQVLDKPTAFEKRQQLALEEIKMLLRERGL